MTGGALEKILGRLLIKQARVDGAVVQLAEREQRRQRDAAVAAFEGTVDEKREEECRDFVRKRRVRLSAEHRHLRPLHGVEQAELRFDDAGMGLIAAEFNADGAMQFDQIRNAEIARAAAGVSR